MYDRKYALCAMKPFAEDTRNVSAAKLGDSDTDRGDKKVWVLAMESVAASDM